jgi:hypothetical protein
MQLNKSRELEMGRMRALLAIALITFGFAGAARAADLAIEHSRYSAGAFGYGERAGMLLVYDNQPGVFVRAYWRAPWRDHHYFPATGKMPTVGRAENLNAHGMPHQPAKTFQRFWSNAAALQGALEREQPVYLLPPDAQAASRQELPPQNPKP